MHVTGFVQYPLYNKLAFGDIMKAVLEKGNGGWSNAAYVFKMESRLGTVR